MTIEFDNVYVKETSTVVGKKESKGPLYPYFNKYYEDFYCGQKTFEEAEIEMIKSTISYIKNDYDLIIGADLSNQLAITSKAIIKFKKPFIGVYTACASACEAITIASNLIQNGNCKSILSTSSSHNLTAERQFRFPVEYGAARKKTQTFTTTAAAAILLTNEKTKVRIKSTTTGKIIDSGSTNPCHMGEVMSIAAADTIYTHLKNMKETCDDYDMILTGDLGKYGKAILKEVLNIKYKIKLKNYDDCGCMLYKEDEEDINAGGSGVACGPSVVYSYIYKMMKEKKMKKVLFVATGSLHNTTLVNQKSTIPSIANAVCFEVVI
ncbi:MAG: stage V sporulation protein AD [Bacilli bacterium]